MKNDSFTLKEIASFLHAQIEGDSTLSLSGVNDLSSASKADVSFLANERYTPLLKESHAGVIIVHPNQTRPEGRTYLLHDNPSLAFQQLLEYIAGPKLPETCFKGIHPTAIIHETAHVDTSASIGPYAVIDGHSLIHSSVSIGAHAYIGPHCVLHSGVIVHPHAVLREGTHIGERSIIQPGAVLGSCGFGYSTDASGVHRKLEQRGVVILAEDVEVGANTTIDRARFKKTSVGKGTKIDNLVQVAHNVKIGSGCLLCSQVGIAGSTTVGNHVVLGGKAGLNGHIELCDGVMVAACSSVSKTIKQPGKFSGVPAMPIGEYNRMASLMRHIESLFKRVRDLENQSKVP